MSRVLVVDDFPDAADSLSMLLACWGHDVRTAGDGPSALAVAAEFHPKVVLLDIRLPGMDGYEVAQRLRALPGLTDTLLIALTGHGEESVRQRALEVGFDLHLLKPADLDELRQLLAGSPGERSPCDPPHASPSHPHAFSRPSHITYLSREDGCVRR